MKSVLIRHFAKVQLLTQMERKPIMATKTFEAKIYVEGSGSPIPAQAQNISEASRFIKAQYGPRFKRFFQAPREVKK